MCISYRLAIHWHTHSDCAVSITTHAYKWRVCPRPHANSGILLYAQCMQSHWSWGACLAGASACNKHFVQIIIVSETRAVRPPLRNSSSRLQLWNYSSQFWITVLRLLNDSWNCLFIIMESGMRHESNKCVWWSCLVITKQSSHTDGSHELGT